MPSSSKVDPFDKVLRTLQRLQRRPGVLERSPHPEVPYMFHCHILDHEDLGMMGRFEVR